MKTWRRLPVPTYCGRCGGLVAADIPVLEIRIGDVRPLWRCEMCAGEPVNETPQPTPLPPAPAFVFTALKDLAGDYTRRRTGDRE